MDQRSKRGLKPGQLDPETAEFAHRARELSGRRSYLKNFWYAAGARPRARLLWNRPTGHWEVCNIRNLSALCVQHKTPACIGSTGCVLRSVQGIGPVQAAPGRR